MSLGGSYRRASVFGHGIVTREWSKMHQSSLLSIRYLRRVVHSQIQSGQQFDCGGGGGRCALAIRYMVNSYVAST